MKALVYDEVSTLELVSRVVALSMVPWHTGIPGGVHAVPAPHMCPICPTTCRRRKPLHPPTRTHATDIFVLQPRKFSVKQVPIPQINDDEILLKILICGFCGTDVSGLQDTDNIRGIYADVSDRATSTR